MGIIARQTFKNNLLAYLGVAVGVLAQLLVYPEALELKGFIDAVIGYGRLLMPFVLLGVHGVLVRFLPFMEGDKEKAAIQLFNRGLVVVLVGFSVAGLLLYLLGDQATTLLEWAHFDLREVAGNGWAVLGVAGAFAMGALITAHLSNFQRIALPVVFNSLVLKVGLPLTVMAVVWGWFSRSEAIAGVVGLCWLAVVGLLAYAAAIGKLGTDWGRLSLKGKSVKNMVSLAGFSILGALGSVVAVQLDVIMVNSYEGNTVTSIYTFAVFASLIISIPFKAITGIASPLVAGYVKEKNYSELQSLFKMASQVLFAAGGMIFVGAVVCLPYVYGFTTKTTALSVGYLATIILCGGQLVDQLTSLNGVIVGYSNYYRWNVVALLIMAGINVGMNFLFLGFFGWGIEGAALATLISLSVFNLTKILIIREKMGVHPFSLSLLYTAGVLTLIGTTAYFLPLGAVGPYVQFLVRGSTIVGLFLLYLRFTNGVPPIRRALAGGLKSLF